MEKREEKNICGCIGQQSKTKINLLYNVCVMCIMKYWWMD